MNDCIFCEIVKGELPSDKLYEDNEIIAINDINPVAPVHVLIIPKVHYNSVLEIKDTAIVGRMTKVAVDLAEKLGIESTGFRLAINTGKDAGQSVEHVHMHLLGGKELPWP